MCISPDFLSSNNRSWPWPEIRLAILNHYQDPRLADGVFESRALSPLLANAEVHHVIMASPSRPGRPANQRHFLVKRSPYAAQEAQALAVVNNKLAGTELAHTVPKLVGLLEESSILITDYQQQTTSLAIALFRAQLPGGQFLHGAPTLRYAHDLGHWLGRFQQLLDDGRSAIVEAPADARERLYELTELGPHRVPRFFDAFEGAAVRAGKTPMALSHGDLAPRNVLIGAEGLHIVDWEMAAGPPRPLLFDAHHCMAVMNKNHFPTRSSSSVKSDAARCFWDAYTQSSPLSQAEIDRSWKVSRLHFLVIQLSRQVRAHKRQPSISYLTGRHTHIQTLIQELTDEMDHC